MPLIGTKCYWKIVSCSGEKSGPLIRTNWYWESGTNWQPIWGHCCESHQVWEEKRHRRRWGCFDTFLWKDGNLASLFITYEQPKYFSSDLSICPDLRHSTKPPTLVYFCVLTTSFEPKCAKTLIVCCMKNAKKAKPTSASNFKIEKKTQREKCDKTLNMDSK